MLIDAHTHVFAEWPFEPVPDPASRGSPERLRYELEAHGVSGAFVIASPNPRNPDNNATVLSAARRWPEVFHAFGHVDVASATRDTRLEALFGPDLSLLAGIAIVPLSSDDLLGATAERLIGEAAARRLILNIATWPTRGADIAELARRHSSLAILWNEMGNARVLREQSRETYLAAIAPVFETPNVHLKISGFPRLAAQPWSFPFAGQAWLVRELLERVGADRLLWGSEFPGYMSHVTYRQALETVRIHVHTHRAGEVANVLGGNALRLLAAATSTRRVNSAARAGHAT